MSKRWLVAAATTGLILLGLTPPLDAQQGSPVELVGDDAIDLSTKPAELVIQNNSTITWTLDVRVAVATTLDGATAPVGVPVQLTIGRRTQENTANPTRPAVRSGVRLRPVSSTSAGSRTIKLDIAAGAERVGQGELTIIATPVGPPASGLAPAVLRREITTDQADPVPAVSEASGLSNDGPTVSAYVPLESPGPCPPADEAGSSTTTSTIDQVTLTDGDQTVTASASCGSGEENAADRSAVLQVTATDVDAGEELTGTLSVGDDEVEITLARSSPIYSAIALMIIGFLIAYLLRWAAEVFRPRVVLRRRFNAARRSIPQGQAAYVSALRATVGDERDPCTKPRGALKGPERHHLGGAAMECELEALLARRKAVRLRLQLHMDEQGAKDLAEVSKSIDALSAVALKWPSLAETLRSVRAQVDENRTIIAELAPTLLAKAVRLLEPDTDHFYSSSDATALMQEVEAIGAAFTLMPTVDKLVAAAEAVRVPLPSRLEADLVELRARLGALRSSLKHADDAKSLIEGGLKASVEAIRKGLDGLPPVTVVQNPEDAADQAYEVRFLLARAVDAVKLGETIDITDFSDGDEAPVPTATPDVDADLSWGETVEGADFVINGIDGVLFLVALALSLWSGLVLYYFGKAWGSWLDYATLLVWAGGTTATVSALFDATKRFGDRRFAAPAASSAAGGS